MEKLIIINVKNVRVEAWEAAKTAAAMDGATLGEYLSDALIHYVQRNAAAEVIPPGPPVINIDLGEVATVLASMHAVGIPVQKRVGREINRVLHLALQGAAPRRPAPLGIAEERGFTENGPSLSRS